MRKIEERPISYRELVRVEKIILSVYKKGFLKKVEPLSHEERTVKLMNDISIGYLKLMEGNLLYLEKTLENVEDILLKIKSKENKKEIEGYRQYVRSLIKKLKRYRLQF